MKPIIFFDIDGVLNDHKQYWNRYCGIKPECAMIFQNILEETDARIVLTSSWRYMVLCGEMTVKGMGYILSINGIDGTRLDDVLRFDIGDGSNRGMLISRYIDQIAKPLPKIVVLDDCPEGMEFGPVEQYLVKTNGEIGITAADATEVIRRLL